MKDLTEDYKFFSQESFREGVKAENKRILKLIKTVIDKYEFRDFVGRDRDWNGDPNLLYKLEIPHEIVYLLTGEETNEGNTV